MNMTVHGVTMQSQMSEEIEYSGPGPTAGGGATEEAVQGVPVLAEVRPIERAPAGIPAVQAAAAAATGFVAGAATIALVRRRSARRLARPHRNAPRRPVDMLPIVGSRTFLIDVHLVAKPD